MIFNEEFLERRMREHNDFVKMEHTLLVAELIAHGYSPVTICY